MSDIEQKRRIYNKRLHAMQSGIAQKLQNDHKYGAVKDLRVGIDSAHVTQAAIVELLIQKGVFKSEEFWDELIHQTELEVSRHEADLSKFFGADIKLG